MPGNKQEITKAEKRRILIEKLLRNAILKQSTRKNLAKEIAKYAKLHPRDYRRIKPWMQN